MQVSRIDFNLKFFSFNYLLTIKSIKMAAIDTRYVNFSLISHYCQIYF